MQEQYREKQIATILETLRNKTKLEKNTYCFEDA